MRKTSQHANRIHHGGRSVKGRFVDAGIPLVDVAALAEIAPNTLTDYLTGRLRRAERQRAIWEAYCIATCHDVSIREFWGPLLNPKLEAA